MKKSELLSLAKPDCPHCGGKGWFIAQRWDGPEPAACECTERRIDPLLVLDARVDPRAAKAERIFAIARAATTPAEQAVAIETIAREVRS